MAAGTVEIVRATADLRVIRVFVRGPKVVYRGGQYGSLGLPSERDGGRVIKRPYSVSTSIVNVQTGTLVDPQAVGYYEFYFNLLEAAEGAREQLTPKLFQLRDGDEVGCGTKIVGHYTLERVRPDCDILLIATTTGEAANNSILNEWLLQRRSGNSCQVVCGPPGWRSLYACEHEALSILCKNYRHVALGMDSCDTLETRVAQWLTDPDIARDEIGFSCDPATTHVFLCGDPLMIGAPTKRGGWQYDVAASGLVPLLMRHGFTVKTRFKDGNVEYETYW